MGDTLFVILLELHVEWLLEIQTRELSSCEPPRPTTIVNSLNPSVLKIRNDITVCLDS